MNNTKRIAIIGATSSIAEHCARIWAQQGSVELILVGRDQRKLEIVAADLLVRSQNTKIEIVVTDFIDPTAIQNTVDALFTFQPIDIALIAHGTLPEQQDCQSNLGLNYSTLEINGISPVLYAEAFAQHMTKLNQGSIAIIGSVAGDRGRKSNYVYGAAKGLVTRYAQGLQHRFAGTGVNVSLIKPGPTNTPMTAAMKGSEKFATPEEVAKTITAGIESKKAVIYAPAKWWLIMMVIRHLPSLIFNKMNI
ncbi:SDR family NAD(P)-dependent oxidoreductase [Polynucleobacter asymbioticus]|uniref:Short-chain dehydrogenase/reductase SDR n=1 Tax=Polynucleobacter asymbioticus (strain DSM 18221 / CIP 109841 / QLW-P1DMWA-1) TaxID=312153 RepID=A4SVN4_POLAQ|nr:SDR family NAD(P)-dependent oxidoreductase [Polynucleobacter asymbioticus]ABP33548.1 short-chain dehydrogenase/reductase SDR [Polynucleobacter asymbioticus QLW-P1DMWA-1]